MRHHLFSEVQKLINPTSWHSHVYFDTKSHPQADALVTLMQEHFGPDATITYGRWHHKPVGPHPDFSIQLEFPHELFTEVMTFLSLNRNGLLIFSHPNTGDNLLDHCSRHLQLFLSHQANYL